MPESTRQREAFDLYWGLGGERSIERLHAELELTGGGPSLRTLYEWSRVYHWQDRLADLEREARNEADESRRRAISEMYERQAKEGLLLQQKGAEWLSNIESQGGTAEAAIRAIVEGAKLERMARGEPSEHVHQEGEMLYGGFDLRSFSTEELRRLVEFAEHSSGGSGEAESR